MWQHGGLMFRELTVFEFVDIGAGGVAYIIERRYRSEYGQIVRIQKIMMIFHIFCIDGGYSVIDDCIIKYLLRKMIK